MEVIDNEGSSSRPAKHYKIYTNNNEHYYNDNNDLKLESQKPIINSYLKSIEY